MPKAPIGQVRLTIESRTGPSLHGGTFRFADLSSALGLRSRITIDYVKIATLIVAAETAAVQQAIAWPHWNSSLWYAPNAIQVCCMQRRP